MSEQEEYFYHRVTRIDHIIMALVIIALSVMVGLLQFVFDMDLALEESPDTLIYILEVAVTAYVFACQFYHRLKETTVTDYLVLVRNWIFALLMIVIVLVLILRFDWASSLEPDKIRFLHYLAFVYSIVVIVLSLLNEWVSSFFVYRSTSRIVRNLNLNRLRYVEVIHVKRESETYNCTVTKAIEHLSPLITGIDSILVKLLKNRYYPRDEEYTFLSRIVFSKIAVSYSYHAYFELYYALSNIQAGLYVINNRKGLGRKYLKKHLECLKFEIDYIGMTDCLYELSVFLKLKHTEDSIE